MSILKNDSNNLHTDMTIAVFPDDARIPTTANGNFGTVKYLQLKNRRLSASTNDSLWYPGGGDSLLIKCELNENATGTIFGTSYNSNGIQLIIENKTIKWMRNGALMKSVAWSKGVHTIGWVSAANDTSNPYYDGVVDTNVSLGLSHHAVGASIGALATLSGTTTSYSEYLTSSASWAIRIHEVLAFSYKENVDENMDKRWYHLYAATNLSATEYGMFETRTHLKFFVNAPTDQGSVSVGDRYPYGVQLFDLKTVFGSRYKDMMGIITEPGTLDGIDTECGWTADTADVMSVVSNSGVTRNFVFHVGNNAQDSLPLPSGWTPSYAGTITYEKGELHRGRKPLWSIWNDAIRFGKYAVTLQSGMQKMMFNILRRNNGDLVSKALLEDFDGYDTSKNYPPSFEWNGKVISEFHNGVMCTLDKAHVLSGGYDFENVFAMNRAIQGSLGMVKLGNLPLWNYTIAEQAVAGIDKLSSIGGGLKLSLFNPGALQEWEIMGTIFKTSADTGDLLNGLPKLLSSESSEDTKNLFKYNGIDCSGYFRSDSVLDFIRGKILMKGSRKVRASLVLVNDVGDVPADNKLVDCSNLIPERDGELIAQFDTNAIEGTAYKSYTQKDDRLVIGEQDGVADIGTTEHLIGVQGAVSRLYQRTAVSAFTTGDPTMGYALALGYALKNKNSNALLKMFGTGATSVFGYVEVTEEKKTSEDKTSSIVHTTIPGDDYDYDVYTLSVNSNFTSCDVRSKDEVSENENLDGSVKFEVVYTIPAGSDIHTDTIRCSMVDKMGRQTMMEFSYAMSGVAYEQTLCKVEVIFTNPTGASAQIQIISHMEPDSQSVNANMVTNYKIQNRLYGFTKPVKNNSAESAIQTDYYLPFVYDNTSPWQSSDVSPFAGVVADKANGEMGALFFMWKDLYGNTSISQDRPTNPFTAHMRLFSTANGPHAWDLYGSLTDGTGHRSFDGEVSENPYLLTASKKYMFHNHDRLIPYNDDNNTFLEAFMSVWNGQTQVTDGEQAWVGRTINIYAGVLHEPKDGAQAKTLLCTFGPITSSHVTNKAVDSTSGGFRCILESDVTYYDYANFPTGDGWAEYMHTGMYHLKVIQNLASTAPTPGTMYYIDIV